jgi:hypothetical protein
MFILIVFYIERNQAFPVIVDCIKYSAASPLIGPGSPEWAFYYEEVDGSDPRIRFGVCLFVARGFSVKQEAVKHEARTTEWNKMFRGEEWLSRGQTVLTLTISFVTISN